MADKPQRPAPYSPDFVNQRTPRPAPLGPISPETQEELWGIVEPLLSAGITSGEVIDILSAQGVLPIDTPDEAGLEELFARSPDFLRASPSPRHTRGAATDTGDLLDYLNNRVLPQNVDVISESPLQYIGDDLISTEPLGQFTFRTQGNNTTTIPREHQGVDYTTYSEASGIDYFDTEGNLIASQRPGRQGPGWDALHNQYYSVGNEEVSQEDFLRFLTENEDSIARREPTFSGHPDVAWGGQHPVPWKNILLPLLQTGDPRLSEYWEENPPRAAAQDSYSRSNIVDYDNYRDWYRPVVEEPEEYERFHPLPATNEEVYPEQRPLPGEESSYVDESRLIPTSRGRVLVQSHSPASGDIGAAARAGAFPKREDIPEIAQEMWGLVPDLIQDMYSPETLAKVDQLERLRQEAASLPEDTPANMRITYESAINNLENDIEASLVAETGFADSYFYGRDPERLLNISGEVTSREDNIPYNFRDIIMSIWGEPALLAAEDAEEQYLNELQEQYPDYDIIPMFGVNYGSSEHRQNPRKDGGRAKQRRPMEGDLGNTSTNIDAAETEPMLGFGNFTNPSEELELISSRGSTDNRTVYWGQPENDETGGRWVIVSRHSVTDDTYLPDEEGARAQYGDILGDSSQSANHHHIEQFYVPNFDENRGRINQFGVRSRTGNENPYLTPWESTERNRLEDIQTGSSQSSPNMRPSREIPEYLARPAEDFSSVWERESYNVFDGDPPREDQLRNRFLEVQRNAARAAEAARDPEMEYPPINYRSEPQDRRGIMGIPRIPMLHDLFTPQNPEDHEYWEERDAEYARMWADQYIRMLDRDTLGAHITDAERRELAIPPADMSLEDVERMNAEYMVRRSMHEQVFPDRPFDEQEPIYFDYGTGDFSTVWSATPTRGKKWARGGGW